ncbi:unnamed protein product [Sphagnum jensenii]|uniref:DUF1279 domain-containing protein n=1 Tax=Sphagnum jensenii TaxID=128206 RepID=A0ABP0VSJ7_9BRYO
MAQLMAIASSGSLCCRICMNSRGESSSSSLRRDYPATGDHFLTRGLGLRRSKRRHSSSARVVVAMCAATEEKEKNEVASEEEASDADSVTRKFGLEAGLWKIFTSKDNGEEGTKGNKTNKAKELLAQYGGAYLVTSISLSLVSFALCYALVQGGVDVPALLEKVGIRADGTGEKVGTFALAYAAHKAASPIRFPPTVALTPIVAGWFGKKPAGGDNTQPK